MFNIRSLAIRLLALLIAFTLHEFAHAFVSYSLGDRSAGTHNRLTINPLAHIDWMGLLCLFAFGFGWGKLALKTLWCKKNQGSTPHLKKFSIKTA